MFAVVLSACSQSVPECSDKKVTKLVSKIVKDDMRTHLGEKAENELSYDIGLIVTTNTNERTGAHECSMLITTEGKKEINRFQEINHIPVTYTVEIKDDSSEIYVKVTKLMSPAQIEKQMEEALKQINLPE